MLRVAAGEGRLSLEELEERLETALSARTVGELAVLTADLPAVAGQASVRPRTSSGSGSKGPRPAGVTAGWCRGAWRSVRRGAR
ncbi:DUF1707 domain-containing protein [Streptomyces massasporeus]|uniref:DUF1707 domain-containing protein n=1 Tax=Streptomyces massasporeus TaxID=67324 RepID=UPI0037121B7E